MAAECAELRSGIVAELEAASRLRTSQFFITQRPWLDLYGVRVNPKAAYGSVSNNPVYDPALLHRVLPDELLHEIFVRMPPYYLGRASCVCRKWRYAIRNPVFWRNACLKAWQVLFLPPLLTLLTSNLHFAFPENLIFIPKLFGVVDNYNLLHARYESSWRKMWLLRPRVRTDGLYVSRNTYIHTGVAEWRVRNPVHLVCYYRYMRFFPSGKFLYKNSSEKVKDVAKVMTVRASTKSDCVHRGQYSLTDDKVEAALLYPGTRPTAWRIRLRLRGTTAGANNRMDCVSLVTTGLNSMEANYEDMLGIVEGWEDDESHSDVPATSHKRGLSAFVFVPFEEVGTSVLNLPVDKMDYYVPD